MSAAPAQGVRSPQNSLPADATGPSSTAVQARSIACALGFSVVASIQSTPLAALFVCAFPALLFPLCRPPWQSLRRVLVPVNGFFLFLWLTLPLSLNSASTDALAVFGPFAISREGVQAAFIITCKGNAIAATVLMLVAGAPLALNARALLHLRVPAKFVTLVLLTHANIALMTREYATLMTAAKLRGFQPRTTLASYRTFAWLMGMLLIRSFQRSNRVNRAMSLRGFCGRFALLTPPGSLPVIPASSLLPLITLAFSSLLMGAMLV
jgi:ABC-type cobalt transport system, permease component CbiQ and related transporters